jgi:LacI family transcriptional regulator
MPKKGPKRVALALELEWLYRRHSQVFTGALRFAREAGDWICVVDEFVDRVLPASKRAPRPYDGVIARASSELAKRSKQCGVPVVNVWFNSPARDLPSVLADFTANGRLAAEHLIDRGFQRFTCVSAPKDRSHHIIIEAFHKELAQHGFVCECAAVPIHPTRNVSDWERFQKALDRCVANWKPPVGIYVAFSDVSGRYVTSTCRRHGLRVPEDVAIVVGSNELDICLEPAPSLSAIETRYDIVGYEAARLLNDIMDGAPQPTAPILVPPAGVIGRQSTDFFATEDPTIDKSLRFILDHCQEPIGVDDVADAIGLSRRTLERRFQKQTGRAVFAEIRRLRIERAKRLLLDSDGSVKQIANTCGFSSSSQMNQVFERFVGSSPSTFRRKGRTRTVGTTQRQPPG